MSFFKKVNKRGGYRPGGGRRPGEYPKTANLSMKISEEAKKSLAEYSEKTCKSKAEIVDEILRKLDKIIIAEE